MGYEVSRSSVPNDRTGDEKNHKIKWEYKQRDQHNCIIVAFGALAIRLFKVIGLVLTRTPHGIIDDDSNLHVCARKRSIFTLRSFVLLWLSPNKGNFFFLSCTLHQPFDCLSHRTQVHWRQRCEPFFLFRTHKRTFGEAEKTSHGEIYDDF